MSLFPNMFQTSEDGGSISVETQRLSIKDQQTHYKDITSGNLKEKGEVVFKH